MNGEQVSIWKDGILVCFNGPFRHSPVEAEENHEISQDWL